MCSRFVLESSPAWLGLFQFCYSGLHLVFLFLVAWISPKAFVAKISFGLGAAFILHNLWIGINTVSRCQAHSA